MLTLTLSIIYIKGGLMMWLESISEVQAEADFERDTCEPRKMAPDSIRTPDSIVADIEAVDAMLNRALRGLHDADLLRGEKKRVLDAAAARARLEARQHEGTVPERNAIAQISVESEQWEADLAETTYRYMKSTADWLESRKSSLQTQSKLILATYQLGRGKR